MSLEAGIAAHRAFARRSASPYTTRLRNAEHFAVALIEGRQVIEPLGWALAASQGAGHQDLTRAPDIQALQTRLLAEGWQRIAFGEPGFAALWEDLLAWCQVRKTRPSARTGRQAAEDRVFWLAP